MTDFDWDGGHTALDDWWVNIYTKFVTAYGVDGYRLDVGIYRPDLWERVRRNAAAAGHPIAIWEEANSVIPGVTDFTQRENVISTDQPQTDFLNTILVNNLPGFYDRKFGRAGYYQVEIKYADGDSLSGSTKGEGRLVVRLAGLDGDRVGRRSGEETAEPDGLPDIKIELENVSRKPISNIIVHNDMGENWELKAGDGHRLAFVDAPEPSDPLIVGPRVNIYIATLAWGASSIQLSCHDNGWEGFPPDRSPYAAQGSRSVFGYSFLFSPMIPLFFSGEEFNAGFHALPGLSPYLFGGKGPGQGRWLYGNMLDWGELKEPEHADMLIDVKRMISIRKQHSKVFSVWPAGKDPNLKAVQHNADIEVPVPYLRWDDHVAIVIAANRNKDQDAHITLRIPLADIGLGGQKKYVVTDLWSAAGARTCTETELESISCAVRRDKTLGGGLSVLKIEPASSDS